MSSPQRPAASKRAKKRLPNILVTEKLLSKRVNRVCAICLEDQILGSHVRRMPCQHVFCEECILSWLDRDNSCPLCKYELPTDSVVYERSRKKHLKCVRVTEEAISKMKTAELTRLCEYIGVDLSKCIDRSDLEATLKRSGKIKLIEEEKQDLTSSLKDEVSEEPLSLISRVRWNTENLSCLRVRDLKFLMQRLNLSTNGCITKSDLIVSLVNAQTRALE